MARTVFEQTIDALTRAQHILIVFPHTHGVEALGSALGLKMAMEQLGKQVDVVAEGFSVPGAARFLPHINEVLSSPVPLQKFIVSVKLPPAGLSDLSYGVEEQQLNIYLTPKSGAISAQDITTRGASFPYDLIVTVDTRDLESLGGIFTNNTDFFYHTTIINIDH